jgi:hypothetical protein
MATGSYVIPAGQNPLYFRSQGAYEPATTAREPLPRLFMPMYEEVLLSLSPLHVIVVAIVGFLLGAVWYSPLLFVKAWMAETKITPEIAKAAGSGPGRLISAFLLTLLSTCVLAALVADHRSHGPIHGAELGLLVGVGLVASRQAVNSIFSLSSLRLFLIVAGHDVVLCVLQGMILASWR